MVRHMLRREAERGDELARRCFPASDWRAEPDVPLHVLRELLKLNYTSHVRELKARLWQALAAEQLGIAGDAERRSVAPGRERPATADIETSRSTEPPSFPEADDEQLSELSAASVQAALDQNNGVLEATWRALGLKNRFVLLRLIKRYDLEIRKRRAPSGSPPRNRG
jgi:transcriptional regulator with GAF, ATPase, and Fis domain